VHGDAGDPVHAGPLVDPERQIGHGCAGMPVRTAVAFSATSRLATPFVVSIEPPLGAANLLSTQVERPPFTIGSGVPKLQPVAVQSYVEPGAPSALKEHDVPALQSATQRFVEPSGVGPSGTVELAPPRLKPPHVRFLITVVPATSLYVWPHTPPAALVVKSTKVPPGGSEVDVVLDAATVDVVVVMPPLPH
jgi:hypothetical protein